MSFNPTSLLISSIFGAIGFVGFVYGRRMARFPHMLVGAVLMTFPWLVSDPLTLALVGALVIVGWVVLVRMGV